MRSSWQRGWFVFAVGCLFTACSGDSTWSPVAPDALSPTQAAQLVKAEQARDGLQKALVAELTEGLKQGPAHAVAVCRERAPVLAAEQSKQFGVRLGRTSMSLRNPRNAAPAWAQQHIAGGPAAATFFTGSSGELGTLFPIRLMPQCVQCHGKATELLPEVREVLAKQYPQDRATGFAAGDLRGWFWVEVPKP